MSDENAHGLKRYIPEGVKREIRRRCGFGCVICGLGFYDYEHFDPDFKDAKEHNPEGMTLLCSQCNQKRARGRLSAKTVALANSNPKCRQDGFASEFLDIDVEPIAVVMGNAVFTGCPVILRVCGVDVLSIEPPEDEGSPFLLSGFFCDSDGNTTLTIERNTWKTTVDNWDVQCEGPRIEIRRGPGDIVLVLRVDPPRSVIIEKIDMVYGPVRIIGSDTKFKLLFAAGGYMDLSGASVGYSPCAICVE